MPCCLGCFALAFPRLALMVMAIAGYASRAFDSLLWPVLGFFFMPYTTCMYAIAQNYFGGVDRGAGLVLLIVGVVLDLGSHGGGAHYGRRHRTVIVRRDF